MRQSACLQHKLFDMLGSVIFTTLLKFSRTKGHAFEIKTVDEIDQMIDLCNYMIYNDFKDWQRYTEVNILIRGRMDLLTLTSALWNKKNCFMFQQLNSVCRGVGYVCLCVCWKRIWLAAWFYNITCFTSLNNLLYTLKMCVAYIDVVSICDFGNVSFYS